MSSFRFSGIRATGHFLDLNLLGIEGAIVVYCGSARRESADTEADKTGNCPAKVIVACSSY